MVSPNLISRAVAGCAADGAVVPATTINETVKRVESDYVLATIDRSKLYLAQTPQVFRYSLILDAYLKASSKKECFTDDASVVEAAGYKIKIVDGDPNNIKITTPRDLDLMRYLLTIEQESADG